MTCWVVYSNLKSSDGGRWRWVVNFNPRPLYPWERASVNTEYEAGWAPDPVSTLFEMNMSFLYLDSKPGPLSLYYSPYTRAGEPMALGKISLVRDIHCCPNFFIFFTRPLSLYCDKHVRKYSRVSFCDSSFYDDSLLRPLSSRSEHSRLVVQHCRNSSVLSVLSALLALFQCTCVSSVFYFSAVLSRRLWFFHPWRPSKGQKRRKNQNSWRYILSWCLLNHGLGLLQQNKKWFDRYFFQLSV